MPRQTMSRLNKRQTRWLRAILIVVLIIGLIAAVLLGSEALIEPDAHIKSGIARLDLAEILEQERLTEDDYMVLYQQTGLGRSSIDTIQQTATDPVSEILEFQENLYREIEIKRARNSPISKEERVVNENGSVISATKLAPLQNGDILITKSSYVYGWRNGHAALVVDAAQLETLESVVLGTNSAFQSATRWESFPNFMVLRLANAPQGLAEEVAATAAIHLNDIPYDFMVGLTTPKHREAGKISGTQCSHLVWQAYMFFGIDLDSDGGRIVTPKDIANSPLLEIVQVYGVDPGSIWP